MKTKETGMLRLRTIHVVGVFAALASGCVDPDARLRELAAPHVSCTQDELHLVEGRGDSRSATYVVECDGGERYRCISRARPFGDEPDTVCAADASPLLSTDEREQ